MSSAPSTFLELIRKLDCFPKSRPRSGYRTSRWNMRRVSRNRMSLSIGKRRVPITSMMNVWKACPSLAIVDIGTAKTHSASKRCLSKQEIYSDYVLRLFSCSVFFIHLSYGRGWNRQQSASIVRPGIAFLRSHGQDSWYRYNSFTSTAIASVEEHLLMVSLE